MGDIVQLDIFGNEDPMLKKGEQIYQHSMKDGTIKRVAGKPMGEHFHYHKEAGRYWLTKNSSGVLITSSKTIKALKELVQEPEFFDETLTRERIAQAVNRWGNSKEWRNL